MRFFWILLIPFLPVPKVDAEGLFFDFMWNFSPELTFILFLTGMGIYSAIKLSRFYSRFENLEKEVKEIMPAVELRFKDYEKKMDFRFQNVDEKFKNVDLRFEEVNRRFNDVDRKLDLFEKRFDKIDDKLDKITNYLVDHKPDTLRKTK